MRFVLFILSLFVASIGYTQLVIDQEYYSDPLVGDLDRVFESINLDDGMIIAGYDEVPNGNPQLILLRLNEIGEVVWSTQSQQLLTQLYCPYLQHMKIFDDGYIYGLSCNQLWKVDATNGDVIWVTPFSYALSLGYTVFSDYDSTRFLVSYKVSQYNAHLAFIDKQNGLGISSTPMDYGNDVYQDVKVDAYGNVYYGNGNFLHKFNGDNLNQRIWKVRLDNPLDPEVIGVVKEVYIDREGDVYVFGFTDYQTDENVLGKVDPTDGTIIWKSLIGGNVTMKDFEDRFNNLYMTFEHNLVGGGSSNFYAAKLNKGSGILDWFSNSASITPLQVGVCGSREAAECLAVDCDSNIYLSGYYGDSGYGPGIWGLMKLNGVNGLKEYDRTITQDSMSCSGVGEGVGAAIFNNIPTFVGNENLSSSQQKATFLQLDTATGMPSIRHHIGSGYQYASSTVDIQNSNDSMFLLMQRGNQTALRMSEAFNVAEWEYVDSLNSPTKAGGISVNSNSVYLAMTRLNPDSLAPYTMDSTNAILFRKLDRNSGVLIQEDSLYVSGSIRIIEVESDSSGATAYILYSDNSNLYLVRWNISGLSTVSLGTVTPNVLENRPLNILDNYSNNELLFGGEQQLYSIDKTTLQITPEYTYSSTRNIYGLIHENDNIILAGNTSTGIQSLMSIDTSSFSLNWDQTYQSGVFSGAIKNLDTIYTYGVVNGQMQVLSIFAGNGVSEWEYLRPNLSSNDAVSNGLSFSPGNEKLVLVGAEVYPNGTSDIAVDGIDQAGNGNSILSVPDQLDLKSFILCLSSQFDSLLWIGGRTNQISYGKQGVNFLLKLEECLPIIGIDSVTSCDSYTWIDGNTYNSSVSNVHFVVPSASGCDSTIILDLTINNSTTGVDLISACNSYTWIDGNTYTSNNNSATVTLANSFGCDSIVTLDLTIETVDTALLNNGNSLSAMQSGASYQWINCFDSSYIVGETNQTFTPTAGGSYALIIDYNNCIDTTSCITSFVGLNELGTLERINVYPNPTSGAFKIEFSKEYEKVILEITNSLGQRISKNEYTKTTVLESTIKDEAGVYILKIMTSESYTVIPLIKKQ